MSLINQMLRDLDARSASAAERNGIAGQVRALPPAKRAPVRLFSLVLGSALLGGAAVWVGLRLTGDNASQSTAVLPVPQLVVPMPAPPAESSTLAAPTTLGESLRPGYSLKLDTRLPQVQEERAAQRSEKAAPTPQAQAAPPAQAAQAAKLLPGQIDKQPRGGSSGDAAENEYRKGHAALRRGAGEEAITAFKAALLANPQHAQARQALLSHLVSQKQWQMAQTLAREGLAFDPTRMDWAILIARLQVEQGDAASALDTLAHYAPLAERNPEYLAFYALLLQRSKRNAEAAQKYREALALRSSEGRWWYGLALSLAADHHDSEAHDAFLKAKESGNLPQELAAQVEQRLR